MTDCPTHRLAAVLSVSTGATGLARVLEVATEPVQPPFVMEKELYMPAANPVRVNAFPLTVTVLGLPAPV